MAQTKWVIAQLEALSKDSSFEIVPFVTRGDQVQNVALSKIGGKGLFVSELEQALQTNQVDMAVHSLKDVPATLANGLVLGAIPVREDPRDALILHDGSDIDALEVGAVIGTSSLRRQAQFKEVRPDLVFEPLRGNIDTRLRRVQSGEMAGIILAAAGLRRLGLAEHITVPLSVETCLPAIGQGALGLECREDAPIRIVLDKLNHDRSQQATTAERALLKRLNGGCQVPIAGFAEVGERGSIWLRGYAASTDGSQAWRAEATGTDPIQVGNDVAEQLLSKGAIFTVG